MTLTKGEAWLDMAVKNLVGFIVSKSSYIAIYDDASELCICFFPSSFLLQYGKRTLFRYSAFTGPHVAGEYLANDAVSDLKFTVVIPEDLPVPPVQQVDNLICLIGIIQKIINTLIEPL